MYEVYMKNSEKHFQYAYFEIETFYPKSQFIFFVEFLFALLVAILVGLSGFWYSVKVFRGKWNPNESKKEWVRNTLRES